MGVPAFFRWLTNKYPKIVAKAVEHEHTPERPVDAASRNPNGIEFDNMYLDMNGIIHPCTHPEDRPAPSNEAEMFVAIFDYMDRLFRIVRPRRVVYMAIDGVAPRAKMNQQRSRRFRSAKEAEESRLVIDAIREELIEQGRKLPAKKESDKFDSNCITPGTEFMARLSDALRYYAVDRLHNDPSWKGVKVILSDATVPGEGEHKIMEFIRRQRVSKAYDPQTKHVLVGADADLIMLGLSTHEPYFYVMRDDISGPRAPRSCAVCGQIGHDAVNCKGLPDGMDQDDDRDENLYPSGTKKNKFDKGFIFVVLHVLKEYLDVGLRPERALPFEWNVERAVDDWIFFCFFVGNDFLPHLPSLEIREGAIDVLADLYKKHLPEMKDFITKDGWPDLVSMQPMLKELGDLEDSVFKKRFDDEQRRNAKIKDNRNAKRRKKGSEWYEEGLKDLEASAKALGKLKQRGQQEDTKPPQSALAAREGALARHDREMKKSLLGSATDGPNGTAVNKEETDGFKKPEPVKEEATSMEVSVESVAPKKEEVDAAGMPVFGEGDEDGSDTTDAESSVDEAMKQTDDVVKEKLMHDSNAQLAGKKRKSEELDEKPKTEEDDDIKDDVRFHEAGAKERYYELKFNVNVDDQEEYSNFRKEIGRYYLEGLAWVLGYYYQGCRSWKWYFPYHYAPFASDLVGITDIKPFTEKTEPFTPLEQLMSVMPAASGRNLLPESWARLMYDPKSPILDYYPEDFPVDLNGKKHAWQGVVLLPFIDEGRLKAALKSVAGDLTKGERLRNRNNIDVLIVGKRDGLFEQLCELYEKDVEEEIPIDQTQSVGVFGFLLPDDEGVPPGMNYASPIPTMPQLQDVPNVQVVSSRYIMPMADKPEHIFPSEPLSNARMPDPVLVDHDLNVRMRGDKRADPRPWRCVGDVYDQQLRQQRSFMRVQGGNNYRDRRDGGQYRGHNADYRNDRGDKRYHRNQRGGYGGGGRYNDHRGPPPPPPGPPMNAYNAAGVPHGSIPGMPPPPAPPGRPQQHHYGAGGNVAWQRNVQQGHRSYHGDGSRQQQHYGNNQRQRDRHSGGGYRRDVRRDDRRDDRRRDDRYRDQYRRDDRDRYSRR
eukprot:Clim_evm141s149 gene=Clim_evmTU141s149